MGVNSYLTVVLAGGGLSPPALQGPWCLGMFSCGETQPSPVLGTNHAWPPLMPISFYTGDRAAPTGTVEAAQQHQVPHTPGGGSVPALRSLVLHGGDHLWQRHHRSPLSPREYEHEAVRKRFTRARDDSDQDEGYEWGPATDV